MRRHERTTSALIRTGGGAFTLLEVLVSAGLLSVVMATAFLLFSSGSRGAVMGMAQDSTLEGATQLVETLRTDLEQMVVVPRRLAKDAVRISTDGTRLAFITVDRGLTGFITPRAFEGRGAGITTGPQDLANFFPDPQARAGDGGLTNSGRPPTTTATANATTGGAAGAPRPPRPPVATPSAAPGTITTDQALLAWQITGRPVLYHLMPREAGLFSPMRNKHVLSGVLLASWRFALTTSTEAIESSLARSEATSSSTTAPVTDQSLVDSLVVPPPPPPPPLPPLPGSAGAVYGASGGSGARRVTVTASYINPITGQRQPGATQDQASTSFDLGGAGAPASAQPPPPRPPSASSEIDAPRALYLVIRFVAVDGERRVAERRTLLWDLETARIASASVDRYPIPTETVRVLGPLPADRIAPTGAVP